MNTDISQNNSQASNTPEEKQVQENSQATCSTSEPQAEVLINRMGLRVEITLSWQQCQQLLQGAKHLIPYLAIIGLTTIGADFHWMRLFQPQPELSAPIHQPDSQHLK